MVSQKLNAAGRGVPHSLLSMHSAAARLRQWGDLADAPQRRRWLAAVELAIVLGLIELVLWPLAESRARVPLCGVLASICVFSGWRRWERLRTEFAAVKSLRVAWAVTLIVTLALGILAVVFGGSLGILRGDELFRVPVRTAGDWLGVKLPTVAVQQLLLQWFFLPLVLDIVGGRGNRASTGRGVAVLLCGALFGLVHLPNLLLAALTCVAGTVWCVLYLVHRRVTPLVASHLLLAVLAANIGHVYLLNMSVGSRCIPLLPRWVQLADGRTMCTMPGVISGHIDACERRGDLISVRGWVVDRRTSHSPDELIVWVNGCLREVPISHRRVSRPDVARVLNDPLISECGFRIDLPGQWFAAGNCVRFFGRSPTGILSELNYGKLYRCAIPAR